MKAQKDSPSSDSGATEREKHIKFTCPVCIQTFATYDVFARISAKSKLIALSDFFKALDIHTKTLAGWWTKPDVTRSW